MWLSLIYLGQGSRHKFSLVKLNICQADLPCLICVCVFQRQRKKSHVLKCNVLSDVLNRAGNSPRDRRLCERSWKEISWEERAARIGNTVIWGRGFPSSQLGWYKLDPTGLDGGYNARAVSDPPYFMRFLIGYLDGKSQLPFHTSKRVGKLSVHKASLPSAATLEKHDEWKEHGWQWLAVKLCNLAKTSETSQVLT